MDVVNSILDENSISISKSNFQTTKNFVIGISGPQGSGKSTLAKHLNDRMAYCHPVNLLSLDDFYLCKERRISLSKVVHPLFQTRGIPGTHETKWLVESIQSLKQGRSVTVPVFDKLTDDCSNEVTIDLKPITILEGWCVGWQGFPGDFTRPINELESEEDPDLIWRKSIQSHASEFQVLNRNIDLLIYLEIPHLKYVYRWH